MAFSEVSRNTIASATSSSAPATMSWLAAFTIWPATPARLGCPCACFDDAVSESFGPRIRRHRHQARLSLEALASISGVSRATLSKIERGERNPSLAVAARVADAIGIPLSDLLGDGSRPEVQVVRGQSAAHLVDAASGAIRESVLPAIDGVEIVRYTLRPHSSTGPFHPHAAGVREVFIVLEGSVEVRSGKHRVQIEAGDIAAVPGDLSHELTNSGDIPTRVILVLVRPE